MPQALVRDSPLASSTNRELLFKLRIYGVWVKSRLFQRIRPYPSSTVTLEPVNLESLCGQR